MQGGCAPARRAEQVEPPPQPACPGTGGAGAPCGTEGEREDGTEPRGDNPAFVSFVWRPERAGLRCHTKTSLVGVWSLCPLAVRLGLEVEARGGFPWSCPLSLPLGAGMTEGWGSGALLASGLWGWNLWREEQCVPRQGLRRPLADLTLCRQSLPMLLPGTLLKSFCCQWIQT